MNTYINRSDTQRENKSGLFHRERWVGREVVLSQDQKISGETIFQ